MKLVDIDKIQWRATSHGTPCIYKEDIDNLEPVEAIPKELVYKLRKTIEKEIEDNKSEDNNRGLKISLNIIDDIFIKELGES